MKNSKKIFCALLSLVLILGLCACNGSNNQTSNNGPVKLIPPDIIYGSWYPMPDVSDEPVVIKQDGTCVAGGQQWNWEAKSVEEDKVVLIAGEGEEEFEIEFKYLKTGVPVLAEKHSGWSVQNPQLWQYMKEWYNEETKNTFTLTLFAVQEAGCTIQLNADAMTVESPDGYTLQVTEEQCVVTNAEGNSTTYFPFE